MCEILPINGREKEMETWKKDHSNKEEEDPHELLGNGKCKEYRKRISSKCKGK